MVSLNDPLAIERGAKAVFLDATKLQLEDGAAYTLKMTLEYFFQQFFWDAFLILMFSPWLFLAF